MVLLSAGVHVYVSHGQIAFDKLVRKLAPAAMLGREFILLAVKIVAVEVGGCGLHEVERRLPKPSIDEPP